MEARDETVEENHQHFSEPQIQGFVEFSEILRRVHARLIAQGYVLENGKFTQREGGQHTKTRYNSN